LAAALAETGQYQEAANMAHTAFNLATSAGDQTLAKEIANRITFYESGRP